MRAPRRLLRVDIHEKLREEILACRLSPGADLREQELASRFQVSKSPVRDALLRLEREQLVTIAPRQGYRVAPISLSDIIAMGGRPLTALNIIGFPADLFRPRVISSILRGGM